jgi:hypothetical protein
MAGDFERAGESLVFWRTPGSFGTKICPNWKSFLFLTSVYGKDYLLCARGRVDTVLLRK